MTFNPHMNILLSFCAHQDSIFISRTFNIFSKSFTQLVLATLSCNKPSQSLVISQSSQPGVEGLIPDIQGVCNSLLVSGYDLHKSYPVYGFWGKFTSYILGSFTNHSRVQSPAYDQLLKGIIYYSPLT